MRNFIFFMIMLVVGVQGMAVEVGQDVFITNHLQQGTRATPVSVDYQNEKNGVSILTFDGNYDQKIEDEYNIGARIAMANELYQHLPDDFDFLVVFTTFPVESDADAFYGGIKNDVSGIGLPLFNNASSFGSERLQGIIDMRAFTRWSYNPSDPNFDKTLDALIHEMMHRWGPKVKYVDENAQVSDLTLGRDGSHWNYFLNSQASVMYGALWEETLPGVFTVGAVRESLSPLDLYLMGMVNESAVPPLFLIGNGVPGDREDLPPLLGTEATGNKVVISIDDIIAAEGPRTPSHLNSPHEFSVKFVLLSRAGESIDNQVLAQLLVLQREFQKRFFAETSGIGSLLFDVQLPVSGATSYLSFDPISLSDFDLSAATDFLIREYNEPLLHWADKPATAVRDTAAAIKALQQLNLEAAVNLPSVWMNSYQANNHDEMAWQLLSGVLTDQKRSSIQAQLHQSINVDGGWGMSKGTNSSVIDTALVLRALRFSEAGAYQPSAQTIAYLREQIGDNGEVGFSDQGSDSIGSVGVLAKTLSQFDGFETEVVSLLDYLVEHQNPSGDFGTAVQTVTAIEALRHGTTLSHNHALNQALLALNGMQSVDDSFAGSVFATAKSISELTQNQRPNLYLASVMTNTTVAVAGEQVLVRAAVKNEGSSFSNDFDVSLFLGDDLLATQSVTGFEAAEERVVELAMPTAGLTGGELGMTVRVDATELIAEFNELDNEQLVGLEVVSQTSTPELAINVGNTSFTPAMFDTLPFDVSVNVEVANLSTADLEGVSVGLFRRGSDLSDVELSSQLIDINSNQSAAVDFSILIDSANDDVVLILKVDPNNQFEEINESNNEYEMILQHQPSVDLQLLSEDIQLPSQFVIGETVTILFEFANLGTLQSPGYQVAVELDDSQEITELYSHQVIDMAGGERLSRSFQWLPQTTGDYSLLFKLDPLNQIAEHDELNNEVVVGINVVENTTGNIRITESDVLIQPDPALTGQDNELMLTVHNDGNSEASGFDVTVYELYSDGFRELVHTFVGVSGIAAGSSQQLTVPLNQSHYLGDTTFLLVVDEANQLQEFNENDNQVIKTFRFLSKPDAQVSPGAITLNPAQPVLGENLSINVELNNLGEQGLTNLQVDLYVFDGMTNTFIDGQILASLAGGESGVVNFDYAVPLAGEINGFEVVLDQANAIDESIESNNTTVLQISLQDQEFYLSDDVFSPNGDGIQDQVQVIFNLENSDIYQVTVYDFRGVVVKEFAPIPAAQYGDLYWDGRDQSGAIVVDGEYRVSITGQATGLVKHSKVWVDTNRSTFMRSLIADEGTFYDLNCLINDQTLSGRFSPDGMHLVTTSYQSLDGEQQHGLFKIKTDASAVTSILPAPITNTNYVQYPDNVGFQPNEFDMITLRYYEADDVLYAVNVRNGVFQTLNVGGMTDFVLEEAYTDFVLVKNNSDDTYHRVSYDPLTAPVLLSFELNGGTMQSVARRDNAWRYLVAQSGENAKVFTAPIHDLTNAMPVTDAFVEGEGFMLHSERGKSVLIYNENTFRLYGSDGHDFLLQEEINFTDEILHVQALDQGEWLVITAAEIILLNAQGRLLGSTDHPYDLAFFQQRIIEQYGSLDTMVAFTKCGEIVHSFDELQSYRIQLESVRINQSSERELYLDFNASLLALIGPLGGCPLGHEYEITDYGAHDLAMKLQWPDGALLQFTSLPGYQVRTKKSALLNQHLDESFGEYFSMASQVHLKDTSGEPPAFTANLWTEHEPLRFSSQGMFIDKALVKSQASPVPHACTTVGETGLGFYQGLDNLAAFLMAKNTEVGIELSGSAFDQHLKSWRLEVRALDQHNNDWQIIHESAATVIQSVFMDWVPESVGLYQFRLSVSDEAGNVKTDLAQAYFGQPHVIMRNFNVDHTYFSPNGDGYNDQVIISYDIMRPTEVLVEVLNDQGEIIRSFAEEYPAQATNQQVVWNGMNDLGELQQSGAYLIKAQGFSEYVSLDLVEPTGNSDEGYSHPYPDGVPPFVIEFPLVSFGYENPLITDIPNYTSSLNINTSTISRQLERLDAQSGLWEPAEKPYPFQYDQFASDFWDDLYREVATDEAGNVGMISRNQAAEFNFRPSFLLHPGFLRYRDGETLVNYPLTCISTQTGVCEDPSRGVVKAKAESVNGLSQRILLFQSLSPLGVDQIKLDIFADGALKNSKNLNLLSRQDVESWLESHEVIQGMNLPVGMAPIKQQGVRYYVYGVLLESADLSIPYFDYLNFDYTVTWSDGSLSQMNVAFDEPGSTAGGEGILFEATSLVFTDFSNVPGQVEQYNLSTGLGVNHLETLALWQRMNDEVVVESGANYYIKFNMISSVIPDLDTTNNRLNLYYGSSADDLNILPVYADIGVLNGHSYQLMLFKYSKRACQKVDQAVWEGQLPDGRVAALSGDLGENANTGLCVLTPQVNQRFLAKEFCNAQAVADSHAWLDVVIPFVPSSDELALLEVFKLDENGQPVSLYTDTNPVVTNSEIAFDLSLDKSDFLIGEHHLLLVVHGVEGDQAEFYMPLLIQKHSVTPTLLQPQAGEAVCATGDEQAVIPLDYITQADNANWYHLQISAAWPGNQQILLDKEPIDYEVENNLYFANGKRVLALNTSLVQSGSGQIQALRTPGYAGPVNLTAEALNSTGISVCHSVTVHVDSLIEAEVTFSNDVLYLSPNADGIMDTAIVANVFANENITVTTEIHDGFVSAFGDPLGSLSYISLGVGQSADVSWDGMLDGQVIADGKYTFVLSMTDECGLVRKVGTRVVVDTVLPAFHFERPLAGAEVPAIFDALVWLDELNLDQVELGVEVNNVFTPVESTVNSMPTGDQFNQEISAVVNLSGQGLGPYPLMIRAVDLAGNEHEASILVQRVEPANLFWQFLIQPRVFSPNDDGQQDLAKVVLGLNQTVQLTVMVENESGQLVRTLVDDINLAAGTHEFEWDGLNDVSELMIDAPYLLRVSAHEPEQPANVENLEQTINLDITSPVVTFNTQQNVIKAEGLISVTVDEENPDLTQVWLQSLEPLGAEQLQISSDQSGSLNVLDLSTLSEGRYIFRTESADLAANITTFSYEFVIDQTAPLLRVNYPVEGSMIGDDQVEITGEIIETNFFQYQLFIAEDVEPLVWSEIGDGVDLSENVFNHEWVLTEADGAYLLRALAIDQAGWETEEIIPLVIDRTPPNAMITTPLPDSQHGSDIQISGTVEDANLLTFQLSYKPKHASDEAWLVLHSGAAEHNDETLFEWSHDLVTGEYDLRLLATDHVGRISEDVINITIDSEPPGQVVGLSAEPQEQENVLLNWQAISASDLAGYHIYRDGILLNQLPLNVTTYLDVTLPEGVHSYWVVAVDVVGNLGLASDVVQVTVDRTPPLVALLNPANNALVSGSVEVLGTVQANDDLSVAQLSLRADGELPPGTVVYQTAIPVSAEVMWVLNGANLVHDQTYVLRLEAWDQAQNHTATEHAFTVDNQAPASPLNLSHQLTDAADVTLDWQANSESDLAGYLVFRNNQIISGGGGLASGLITAVTWLDSAVPDGTHNYHVVAVDHAGNISESSQVIEVTINRRAPDAWFTEPFENHEFESPTVIRATSDDSDIASMLFEYSIDGSVWNLLNNDSQAPFDAILDAQALGLVFGPVQLRVTAEDEGGQVDPSPALLNMTYTDLTAPDAITGLLAQVNGGNIVLDWDDDVVPDLAGYLVSRKQLMPVAELDFSLITPAAITDSTFTDSNMNDGTYQYRVQAIDGHDNLAPAVDSEELLVFSISLEQPYSPLLVPANAAFNGSSSQAGVLNFTLDQTSGTTNPDAINLSEPAEFETDPLTLEEGDNILSVSQTNLEGFVSKISSRTVQVSPIPSVPLNDVANMNDFDLEYTWSAPDGTTFGYLPYLNGEPIFTTERTTNAASYVASSRQSNAHRIFDDNPSTVWSPTWSDVNNGDPTYIQVAFLLPQWVTGVTLEWDEETFGDGHVFAPEAYLVQYMSSVGWVTQQDFTGNNNQTVSHQAGVPYLTNGIRVWMPLPENNFSTIRLRELIVEHQPLTSELNHSHTLTDGNHLVQVSAINSYGFESALTEGHALEVGDVVRPDAVTLSGNIVDVHDAALSWTASVATDVANYQIYRDDALIHSTTDGQILNYLDQGLVDGQYSYRVAVTDHAGNQSAMSNVVLLIVTRGPILPPQNLTVNPDPAGGLLHLGWDASTDPDLAYYQVYRSTQANDGFAPLAQTNSIAISDSVENNLTYYYYVTTVDALGNASDPSNIVPGMAQDLLAPTQPVIQQPTTSGTPIDVSIPTIGLSGAAEPMSEVELYQNGEMLAVTTASDGYQHESFGWGTYLDLPVFSQFHDSAIYRDFNDGLLKIFDTQSSQQVVINLQSDFDQQYFWSQTGEHFFITDHDNPNKTLYQGDLNAVLTPTTLTNTRIDFVTVSHDDGAALYLGDGLNPDSQVVEFGLWHFSFADQTLIKLPMSGNIELTQAGVIWVDNAVWFINHQNGEYSEGTLWRFTLSDHVLTEVDSQTASMARITTEQSREYVYYDDVTSGQGSITRLQLNDMSTLTYVDDERPVRISAVGTDSDLAWIAYGCCDRQVINLVADTVLFNQAGFGDRDPAYWGDGYIRVMSSDRKHIIHTPGLFQFNELTLQAGQNDFYVVARQQNGLTSTPSEPIRVNLLAAGLPDLYTQDAFIHVSPELIEPGGTLHGSVVVSNNSAADVASVRVDLQLINPDAQLVDLSGMPMDISLPASSNWTHNFNIKGLDKIGTYTLVLNVDSDQQVVEFNEHNNSAIKPFIVAEIEQPGLILNLNTNQVYPGQNLLGDLSIYNPGEVFDGKARLSITDVNDYPVGFEEEYVIEALETGQVIQQQFAWNSNEVFAGDYVVKAELLDVSETLIDTKMASIEVKATADLALRLDMSSNQIEIREAAVFQAQLQHLGGNTTISGELDWVVLDNNNQVVWQQSTVLNPHTPGMTTTLQNTWTPALPGTYRLQVTWLDGDIVITRELPFSVLPAAPTVRLSGQFSAIPAGIALGEVAQIEYLLENEGSDPMSDVPVTVTVYDQTLTQPLFSESSTASLTVGEQLVGQSAVDTSGMNLSLYTAVLTVDLSAFGYDDAVVLDTINFSTVDLEAPVITVITPSDMGYYLADLDALAEVTDQWSDVALVQVALDGANAQSLQPNPVSGLFTIPLYGLSDGVHQLDWSATDGSGQLVEVSTSFTVDTIPPDIVVSGVESGGVYGTAVTASIAVSDLNLDQMTITLDGEPYVSGTEINTEGAHLLAVSASDLAGNQATIRWQFIQDFTVPTISITHPVHQSVIQTDTTTVSGQTEALAEVTLQVGAETWQVFANEVGLFDFEGIPLVSGINTLSVIAEDVIGNTSDPASVDVTYEPPVTLSGSVSAPTQVGLGAEVEVDGTVHNTGSNNLIQLPVELRLYRQSDGELVMSEAWMIDLAAQSSLPISWSFDSTTLEKGSHRLQLFVQVNQVWQVLTEQLIDFDDVTGPEITINTPSVNQVLPGSFVMSVSVTDQHSAVQSVDYQLNNSGNWLAMAFDGQDYLATVDLNHGAQVVQFRADDTESNLNTSGQVDFVVDNTPPVISINHPTAGMVTNQNVTLDFVVSDDHTVTVNSTLNGAVTTNGAVISAEGEYTLEVQASDVVNNEANEVVPFKVDLTAPTVIIVSPADGAETTEQLMDVTGMASEAGSVTLLLNGHERNIKTQADGSFTIQDVTLTLGLNEYTVEATDQAGNTSNPVVQSIQYLPLGQAQGRIWHDLNQNQIIDAGESGLSDLPVTLSDGVVYQALTDSLGNFEFIDVPVGEYILEVADLQFVSQWDVTTANHPGGVVVSDDQTSVHNIGFYLAEPDLHLDVSANETKGRLLLITDPVTADPDMSACDGVSNWMVDARVGDDWSESSVFQARIYDQNGILLQTETGTGAEMLNLTGSSIDVVPANDGVNLRLFPIHNQRLVAQVSSHSGLESEVLAQPYRIEFEINDGASHMLLDGGLLSPDCALWQQWSESVGDLRLRDIQLSPEVNSDDPGSAVSAPLVRVQRLVLEDWLSDQGWSYTLVDEVADFETEFQTGQYVAYAVLGEVVLPSSLQNALLQASESGDGLMAASGVDHLSSAMNQALGVDVQGIYTQADSLHVLEGDVFDMMSVPIAYGEPVLKVDLVSDEKSSTVESNAIFSGVDVIPPANHAVITNQVGEGKTVFAGLDVLLQAAGMNGASAYVSLLADAIEHVHRLGQAQQLGKARSLKITLDNRGRGVSGEVQVMLPPGAVLVHTNVNHEVTADGFSFAYDLNRNTMREHEFWVQVTQSPVTLDLLVYVDGIQGVYETSQITLLTGELPDLRAHISNCQAGVRPGDLVSYQYLVNNPGNIAIVGAQTDVMFGPELLNPVWTCSAQGGAECPAAAGNGELKGLTLNLPVGSLLMFNFEVTVDAAQSGHTHAEALVNMPEGTVDVNPGDNRAVDDDLIYWYLYKSGFECTRPETITSVQQGGLK